MIGSVMVIENQGYMYIKLICRDTMICFICCFIVVDQPEKNIIGQVVVLE